MLFLRNIDPDYFSPHEVANRSAGLSSKSKEDLYVFIRDLEVQRVIAPGAEVEGYVYTHLDEGIKSINVSLFGNKKMESFQITVEVPGFLTSPRPVSQAESTTNSVPRRRGSTPRLP